LMTKFEAASPTKLEKVRLVEMDENHVDALDQGVRQLAVSVAAGRNSDILQAVRMCVPESVPPLRNYGEPPSEARLKATQVPQV
jgi:hypothetical protein